MLSHIPLEVRLAGHRYLVQNIVKMASRWLMPLALINTRISSLLIATLSRSSPVHSEPEFEQQRLKSGDSVMVEILYHCSSRGVVGLTA